MIHPVHDSANGVYVQALDAMLSHKYYEAKVWEPQTNNPSNFFQVSLTRVGSRQRL